MIQINDRFYITGNTNCYTLQEKTIVQDENSKNYRQAVFKDIGYYTTIEGCINGVLKTTAREYVSKETKNSLLEFKEFIEQENKYLRDLKLDI